MELDRVKFKIDGKFLRFKKLGSYIVLFNIDKIPPHLGLVVDKNYFSLKYNTVQIESSIENLEMYFKKRNKKCIIIELKNNLDKEFVTKQFKKYTSLQNDKTSCLAPIKQSLKNNDNEVNFIYQLIPKLKSNQEISKILSVNFDHKYQEFSIFKYSMEVIQNRIKNISNA